VRPASGGNDFLENDVNLHGGRQAGTRGLIRVQTQGEKGVKGIWKRTDKDRQKKGEKAKSTSGEKPGGPQEQKKKKREKNYKNIENSPGKMGQNFRRKAKKGGMGGVQRRRITRVSSPKQQKTTQIKRYSSRKEKANQKEKKETGEDTTPLEKSKPNENNHFRERTMDLSQKHPRREHPTENHSGTLRTKEKICRKTSFPAEGNLQGVKEKGEPLQTFETHVKRDETSGLRGFL